MEGVGSTGFSRLKWTMELLQMRRRLLSGIRSLLGDEKTAILINGEHGRWTKIRRVPQWILIMAVNVLPGVLKFSAFSGIIEGLITSEN